METTDDTARQPTALGSGRVAEGAKDGRSVRTRSLPVLHELEADWAAGYVYGVIVTLVAVGSEELAQHPNPLGAAGTIAVGVAAIWLAHSFSALVGDWIRAEPISMVAVWERLRHSWPILSAALPAASLVGLAGANAYSVSTGLWLAELVGIAALAAIGIWAALISSRPLAQRVAFPVVLLTIGWGIVGLEQAARHL